MKKSGWYLLSVAFFLFVNFAISPVKILFFSRLVYFLFLVFLFLILRRFNLDKILPPTVGGVAFILFFYGILQKFVLFPLYLRNINWEDNFYSQALITRIQGGRIFSLFALPTLYAVICVILIIFCFHFLLHSHHKKKIPWAFLLILGLFNLILTQSFGGILILSAGILIYLLLSGILNFKYLAPILMVLSLFAFITIALRFSEAKEFEPVKLRLSNWAQCLRIISGSPFLGIGLGNYESEISSYTLSNEAKSIYAHNFFLQFASETGVIITFAILLFLFLSWRKWKPEPHVYKEKIVYITIFVVLLFYNIIDIGFYFFSAGIALSIVLSQVYLKKEMTSPGVEIKRSPFIIYVAVFVLLSLFMIGETISDNFTKNADFQASQKDYTAAEIDYKKSLGINPFNYKALVGIAYVYQTTGNNARAELFLDRALTIFVDFPFANYLKSKLEYERNHYLRSFYYAAAAYNKNKMNDPYRQWMQYLKNDLEPELTRQGKRSR